MKFSLVFVLSIVIWILLIFIIYDKFHTSSVVVDNQTKMQSSMGQVIGISSVPYVKVGQPDKNLVKGAALVMPSPKIADAPSEPVIKIDSKSNVLTKVSKAVTQRDVVKTAKSYKVGGNKGIAWNDFLKLDREVPGSELAVTVPEGVYFNTCSKEVVGNVTEPGLSKENYEWCKWTLSPTGGNVKVCSFCRLHSLKKNCIVM